MAEENIAIIGGTGFDQLPPELYSELISISTLYGNVAVHSISDNYTEPRRLFFVPRHGISHGFAPHQINYRANALALLELGVKYVFATNAVGALRTDLATGSLLLLSDFIDFTRNRPTSLFEATDWKHTDFTTPYSPILRSRLMQAAHDLEQPLTAEATYVCCDGPRFEAPAEIRMFRAMGGDVVGMTGLPEVVMMREAGIEYAAIVVVTNPGAGLSPHPVDHREVEEVMTQRIPVIREITLRAARLLAQP